MKYLAVDYWPLPPLMPRGIHPSRRVNCFFKARSTPSKHLHQCPTFNTTTGIWGLPGWSVSQHLDVYGNPGYSKLVELFNCGKPVSTNHIRQTHSWVSCGQATLLCRGGNISYVFTRFIHCLGPMYVLSPSVLSLSSSSTSNFSFL